MARKRMIDPQIWESAYDKGWTSDDFTVMIAAISAADDEGRGRISMIKRNVGEMISDRKLKKVLENLQDSVVIYDKIYFFLPNFLEYQTINRPKESKIPAPKEFKNNNLSKNNHGIGHGTSHENGETSEVKLSEVKLSKEKLSEGNSLTFFSEDHFQKIKELFSANTKISDPNKTTHIEPVLKFFSQIPEHMTEADIYNCIKEAFVLLDKSKGVRIDLLKINIQQNITRKHEQILDEIKKKVLNEGKNLRESFAKDKVSSDEKYKSEKLTEYKLFISDHPDKFQKHEIDKINELLKVGRWMSVGEIIEPKIKELEEVGLV